MMNEQDMSKRLRETTTGGKLAYTNVSNFLLHAAADEIERLRAAAAAPVVASGDALRELAELLPSLTPKYGDVGSRDVDVAARRAKVERITAILAAAAPASPAAPVTPPADERDRIVESLPRYAPVWTQRSASLAPNPKGLWISLHELRAALSATPAAPLAQQSEPVAWADESKSQLWWAKGHPRRDGSGKVALVYAGSAPASPVPDGQWRGSLAQVITDVPLPDRNDKYQSGFVDAKQAILNALRAAGFDAAPASTGPCSDDTAKDAGWPAGWRVTSKPHPAGAFYVVEDVHGSMRAITADAEPTLHRFFGAALSAAEQGGKA